MKRFHVHAHVQDLAANIAFYSKMFGTAPTRAEPDYAKWMLEDPRINFAISTRGAKLGVDHLGLQTESAEELMELKLRAQAADLTLLDEGQTSCCYARSDKHWITDPQGIAWEHFHTLDSIPVFSEAKPSAAPQATSMTPAASACCAVPAASARPVGQVIHVAIKPASTCC